MQKVKVTRYVSGRRPEYAPSDSDSESSADEEGFAPMVEGEEEEEAEYGERTEVGLDINDRRLLRLKERQTTDLGRRFVHIEASVIKLVYWCP